MYLEDEEADPAPNKEDRPGASHADIIAGLKQYCQFAHRPGFAVMLNGSWGSGKTEFIKSNISELQRPDESGEMASALYVSLYGVSSVAQIEDRLFEQLHPILSSKPARLVTAFLRGAAKTAFRFDITEGMQASASAPEFDLASLMRKAQNRVLILDDLERAAMKPVEILGYINPLIEHEDCRVILLADETNISEADRKEYIARREKTIGRTFEFSPDVEEAYDAFLSLVDDAGSRRHLTEHGAAVRAVFADSGLNNLRLLKQFVWDFEQVWKVLTPAQQSNVQAMNQIMGLLCALSLELRSGRLPRGEFQLLTVESEVARHLGSKDGKPKWIMDAVSDRYPTVSFDSTLLTTETIEDILLRSRVNETEIRAQLDGHPLLSAPEALPSWRALWLSRELPFDQHADALQRFEDDFAARAFEQVGEIHHVVGVSLWLSSLGFPQWAPAEIATKLRGYIDDIYARRTPLSAAEESHDDDWSTGAFGLEFMQYRSSLFRDLIAYERSVREAWNKRAYPRIAATLQRLAVDEPENFLRLASVTNGGPSTFGRIGVLSLIPAAEFARIVAQAQPADRKRLLMTLAIRYVHGRHYPELMEEHPWLLQLRIELQNEVSRLAPIAGDAITITMNNYLEKAIAHTAPPPSEA